MSAVATDNVRDSWGKAAPSWVRVLAEQCDRSSQKKVADTICYSSAVVNQVLKNAYKGDLTAVEQAVRGAFLNATVNCPVLGKLELHRCLQHQRSKLQTTNHQMVRVYKNCRGLGVTRCPHSRIGGES